MKKIQACEPVDYVNPSIGTIGHLLRATIPTVTLPHGMVQIAPITTPGVTDRYLADKIYGFPIGVLSIMPMLGSNFEKYASTFDHDLEEVSPYYYMVVLEDYDIIVKYTVTAHTVYYRFIFPKNSDFKMLLNITDDAKLKILDKTTITQCASFSGISSYVYAKFSKPFESYEELCGNTGVVINYAEVDEEVIDVKIGISYISIEQARRNLEKEISQWDFENIKAQARDIWNKVLSKIEVTGGTKEQKTIFYTALYRAMQRMVNITEDGKYYSGYDNKVHNTDGHDFYVNDGIWDTYRCMHPLQLLLEPERQLDMVNSYLRMYDQSGWLPSFPNLNGDEPVMVGKHAAAMITDTYMKGYHDFDVEQAYNAIKKNAMEATMLPWRNGEITELDKVYFEKGFFPALPKGKTEWVKEVHPFEKRQSVSVTLEHCYDDWCIAQMAKVLNKADDYDYFIKRANNYKNVFDERIGFMAPKTADGKWVEEFDPKYGGGQGGRDYFSECNSWVYTFHVQHDIAGLIKLFGGRSAFLKKLDSLFTEQYDGFKFEFLAKFPDATGLIGQYAHGNEPSFHIPYLYNCAGEPWKTQRKVREIMKLWYNDGPLGICGDEDGGAMSSWYVFSAMGFYPVCPGRPIYDIGSPIFEEIKIHLDNGKVFTIKAKNMSLKNKYIQNAQLNGKPLNKPWLKHSDIVKGNSLILDMGLRPNKQWGSSLD